MADPGTSSTTPAENSRTALRIGFRRGRYETTAGLMHPAHSALIHRPGRCPWA
jgi:hypothetical protein